MNDEINVIEKITQACVILNEVEEYMSGLNEKQSETDLRLSDLYHLIENGDTEIWGETDLRNIANEIKKICTTRRKVKIDLSLMRVYQDNIGKLNNKDNRAMMLEKLNKTNKNANEEYRYRIYTEDELNTLVPTNVEDKIEEKMVDDLE